MAQLTNTPATSTDANLPRGGDEGRERPAVIVAADDLLRHVTALFVHAGLPEGDAATVADCLVRANLRGVDTHGVFRVATYLERLRAGLNNPQPRIAVERVGHAAAHVDGDNGMGAVVGTRAMGEAIAIAGEGGVALVSIRHSNHYGMAAYYVLQALEAGLVGMAFTNASPALPPWGGRAPFLGTSPFAVAVPAGRQPPYVLDMAMSVLARGNVYVAAKTGRAIPPGLALDGAGRPTTDPQALIDGGTMLPFGGVKGSALAMLMDIFGGVLSGAAFAGNVGNPHTSFDRPQDVGHLFVCFRPDLFMPLERFRERMDEFVLAVKAQPRAEGFDAILVPGEREAQTERVRLASGIPLPAEIAEAIAAKGERAGLSPLPVSAGKS
ncbi:Ldh family oxidoreductase [Acuticoccus sp.]|uniref:Ldh family oxidoreductase n=1 Tax=Acuticoccus sp. TaxID=1904378 RepID=UPI003B51DEBB